MRLCERVANLQQRRSNLYSKMAESALEIPRDRVCSEIAAPAVPCSDGLAHPTQPPRILRVEREPITEPKPVRYSEAELVCVSQTAGELHDAPPSPLTALVTKVVNAEGYAHTDEVARRLSRLWGYKRTGRRIKGAPARGR